MIRHPAVQILIIGAIIIAETTLLKELNVYGMSPAVYLVCFVFMAYSQGVVKGVFLGFITGLIVDFLSLSPLGLSSFSLALIGFTLGTFRGKIFLDPIFMPIFLTVAMGIANLIVQSFLLSVFQIGISYPMISKGLVVKIVIYAVIAPIVFGILRFSGAVPQNIRDDER